MKPSHDTERSRRAFLLFDEAIELSGEARRVFVERACAGDEHLRAELERMISAAEEPQFEGVAVERYASLLDAPEPVAAPLEPLPVGVVRAGPWRIESVIGHGGTGTVFLGTRTDGAFDQRVAIKVLRSGLDDSHWHELFRREQRILGRLEHKSIARLLDAGITSDQRPFVALEYVEGQPLTTYCDLHRLPLEDRLRLFVEVCGAVSFAHRALIVHRDLKPTNILVANDGAPKLLDFGIAKLLSEREPDAPSTVTLAAGSMLTPAYAAPEQLRADGIITTGTDVYSLGLVLYELLTGQRARGGTDTELLRSAQADWRPPAPSGRFEDATAAERATARSSSAQALRRRLRGDLDTIVAHATDPQPGRRYSSIDEFVLDLEATLAGLPIRARRDSLSHVAWKFASRHRLGVAAVFLLLASLIGGIVATTTQMRIAQRKESEARTAATRAERVKEFLERLFRGANPDLDAAEPASLRQILMEGAERIERELADEPEVRDELALTIVTTLNHLGLTKEALPLAQRWLGWLESRPDVDARRLLLANNQLADIAIHAGEWHIVERCEQRFRNRLASVELASTERAEFEVDHLVVQANFAKKRGDPVRARELASEAFDRAESVGIDSLRPLELRQQCEIELADYVAAEASSSEALRRAHTRFSPDHPAVLAAEHDLAWMLHEQERHAEALPLAEHVVATRMRIESARSTLLAKALRLLGLIQSALGRLVEAESNLCAALTICVEELGNDHEQTLRCRGSLADLWFERGYIDQGMAEAESLLRDWARTDPSSVGPFLTNYSMRLEKMRMFEHAIFLERQYLDRRARVSQAFDYAANEIRYSLGRNLRAMNRQAEAAIELEIVAEEIGSVAGSSAPRRISVLVGAQNAYRSARQYEIAFVLGLELIALHDEVFGATDARSLEVRVYTGICAIELSRYEVAETLLTAAVEGMTKLRGADHPRTINAEIHRARLEQLQGKREVAEQRLGRIEKWVAENPNAPAGLVAEVKACRAKFEGSAGGK